MPSIKDYNVQEIFEEMEDYLIASMKRTLGYHLSWEDDEGFVWEQWQAKKLREIRKFQRRNKEIVAVSRRKWHGSVNAMLKHQFLEGGKKVDKEFSSVIKRGLSIGRTTPNNDFFEGENNKVKNLIKAIESDFDNASYAALRKMDDAYRQTVLKASMFSSNGAMTIGQSIDMATKDFLAKGIDCIVYKNGAKVNIASYAEMSVRTANKRAHLMGEGERRKEWGVSLVLVSQYMQCSPLCLPWQGRVFIDDVYSGGSVDDGPYPLLSTAIKGHLYHPNCKHTQSTYFEEINEVPKPLRNESGEHYEQAQKVAEAKRQERKYQRLKDGSVDPQNIKKYAAKEKEWESRVDQYEKLSDVTSYEKFKRVLGDKAPKSIDDFQNLKYNDSKAWENLKDEYKIIKQGRYLQNQFSYFYNGEKLFIPNNSVFETTKAIAGGRSTSTLRAKEKLSKDYGGSPESWLKKVGKIESDKYIFDLHWYELDGKQYEMKLKNRGDKK